MVWPKPQSLSQRALASLPLSSPPPSPALGLGRVEADLCWPVPVCRLVVRPGPDHHPRSPVHWWLGAPEEACRKWPFQAGSQSASFGKEGERKIHWEGCKGHNSDSPTPCPRGSNWDLKPEKMSLSSIVFSLCMINIEREKGLFSGRWHLMTSF